MPSKQSEAVRRRWEESRLAMVQPDHEAPDDESWGDLTTEPREVDYLETEVGGLPGMWAVPKRASTDRVLLCIHGGGFVSGSIYTHRKMFGHLAKATGARALLVSYHLLPEGVFPVPAQDSAASARSTSRRAETRHSPTTLACWTLVPGRPASTYASTSSPACCTHSRWPPGGRRRPTTRSARWPAGYGPG